MFQTGSGLKGGRTGNAGARIWLCFSVCAPDAWLGKSGSKLRRLLVSTGSQVRGTVHDVLGRRATAGMNGAWAASEDGHVVGVRRARRTQALAELYELLEPLIQAGRVQVDVWVDNRWRSLAKVVAPACGVLR